MESKIINFTYIVLFEILGNSIKYYIFIEYDILNSIKMLYY